MARTRIEYDLTVFEKLYNQWRRGLIKQSDMCAELQISRQTLYRRLREFQSRRTDPEKRELLFYDPSVPYLLNAPNQSDGLTMLKSIRSSVLSCIIADYQYRDQIDAMAYGNEGARQIGRLSLPQMSNDDIHSFILESERVLSSSGHIGLWIDLYSLCEGTVSEWIKGTSFHKVALVVWNKDRLGNGSRVRHTTEFLLLLQKPPIEAKWIDRGIPDLWTEKVTKKHPHSKPVELQKRLLLTLTKPGSFIGDFTAGGYSTLDACQQAHDRTFIGCDLLPVRHDLSDGTKPG